jgi:cholest-4-en-3-one 26-monooxygenase
MTRPEPLDSLELIAADHYAEHGYPHAAWKRLRRESPVHWFDVPEGVGFWAVTRRADIVRLSKQPEKFLNAPRLAIFEKGAPPKNRDFARHLLNMDPPEHAALRKVASGWFTPRAIRRRLPAVERITGELLAELAGDGESREADFVADLAAPLTLGVLADMLGVPRDDWRLMFQWTNEIAGAADPEYQQPGENAGATSNRARTSLFEYFHELAAERRAHPRDDMVSVLANARVDGAPIPPLELLSYYLLLVVAGNETTRNAASGGLLALIENPGEFEKLRANPGLVEPAVEEIVRFTSPVIQFCRTPVEDLELHGQKIRANDSLCLFYPSANRDEEVFEDPECFRIDRRPNPHIGFGIGEHFCLGANLARLELRAIFRELAGRLEEVELAGSFERMRSSLLGGVKRMPIRYRLEPG